MRHLVKMIASGALSIAASSSTLAAAFQILPPTASGTSSRPEIYLSGDITAATVGELTSLISVNRLEGAILYLDSAGGDPQAGMDLGSVVRRAKMNTAVGRPGKGPGSPMAGSCMSACVLTLAGGQYRFLDPASKVGIHRFYRRTSQATDLAVGQVLSAAITSYLVKMGISAELFGRMVQVGQGQMELLSRTDAFKLNLVNDGVMPAEWAIEGKSGSVYLVGRQSTWNGTGKIIMTCAPQNRIKLSALYDAGGNNSLIVRESTHYSLRVNREFLPVAAPLSRPTISGDYVLASMLLDDRQISSVSAAEQLGFGFHTRNASTFYGFLIDASGQQDLFRSWTKHCSER